MATRNKKKLAASNKKNCEEHPSSKLAQNSNVPRSQEDYITQVSEGIEGRVTKKLSQEFSRTENRILRALARLDVFLMKPLIQGHCRTAPETSRNVFSISQGTNEDDSQSNFHPEAGIFSNQLAQNTGPDVGHDMVTVATEQIGDRSPRQYNHHSFQFFFKKMAVTWLCYTPWWPCHDLVMIILWRVWITITIPCHRMIVMFGHGCQPGH